MRSPFSHSVGYDLQPKWLDMTDVYNATSGGMFEKVIYSEPLNILLAEVKEENRDEISGGYPFLAKYGLKTARSWKRDHRFMDASIEGFGSVGLTPESALKLRDDTAQALKETRPGYARRLGLDPVAFDNSYRQQFGTNSQKVQRVQRMNEKATSVAQQQLFGTALAVKTGETEIDDLPQDVADKVEDIVDSMSETDIRDFAETPHSEIDEGWLALKAVKSGAVKLSELSSSTKSKLKRVAMREKLSRIVVEEAEAMEADSEALEIIKKRHR